MDHITSVTVFTPLVGALLAAAMPTAVLARTVGLVSSGVAFVLSMIIWCQFDGTSAGLQFVEEASWIPALGIHYLVGVDGLSLLLIVLTTFLVPLILVSRWHENETSERGLIALMLALETGMLGALVAFDMVLFYVFWEVMLIPMYFIIGVWGGPNRIYATTKFVIYTVIGSLLMLVAAIVLYQMAGTTVVLELYKLNVPEDLQLWLFAAFALAFAIKVPVWPFHTWLPHAHTEAPTVGSVILAGVLLKMGTYGLLRFAIPLFPAAVETFAPLILALGIIGIIYGALTAWAQPDAKKLVAYSSVSHLGFVVIGSVAVLGTTLSEEALTGAVYQMINHGISTGALFFLVGVIYERRHTRELSQFGGLAKVMPMFTILLIIATLGSVGLPGTGGFVGEFLILLGLFQVNPVAGVLASSGVLLGAVYMLHFCRKILFGPITHEENRNLPDLRAHEWFAIGPLALLVIVMGVYPEAFLAKIRPSIRNLAKHYTEYRLLTTDVDQDHPTEFADARAHR